MNPIARMIKRYIKTPLKYALPLLFIGALVLVSISGCTSPTNTTSPTPTSGDVITTITNAFTSQNFTVMTPFKQTVNGQGNTMYAGVVKNGEKTLVPYAHNVTIEETKSRNDSIARYNAYVAQAEQQGYTGSQQEQGMWYGKIGTGENPPQEVWIHINEPQWWGILLQGSKVEIDMSHNQYTVAVDYMTQA
jgi:hypothetical protein